MTNEEIIIKLVEVEGKASRNEGRIKKLETAHDALLKIATSVELIAQEQSHLSEAIGLVRTDVTNLSSKVEALESVPAKRWNDIVGKVIWALVAAGLTALGLLGKAQ